MARLPVRVTPRSSRDSIDGFDTAGSLRVRVTAPPTGGEANAAVARLLARMLDLPQRDVVLISGASNRTKVFEVPLSLEEVAARIGS